MTAAAEASDPAAFGRVALGCAVGAARSSLRLGATGATTAGVACGTVGAVATGCSCGAGRCGSSALGAKPWSVLVAIVSDAMETPMRPARPPRETRNGLDERSEIFRLRKWGLRMAKYCFGCGAAREEAGEDSSVLQAGGGCRDEKLTYGLLPPCKASMRASKWMRSLSSRSRLTGSTCRLFALSIAARAFRAASISIVPMR